MRAIAQRNDASQALQSAARVMIKRRAPCEQTSRAARLSVSRRGCYNRWVKKQQPWRQEDLVGNPIQAKPRSTDVLCRFLRSGQVAQVVERSPEKAGVGGSTPSLATIPFNNPTLLKGRRGSERPLRGGWRFVCSGLLNQQIGAQFGISEITVKAHRGQVMQKMKAPSLAGLVSMAARFRDRASGDSRGVSRPVFFHLRFSFRVLSSQKKSSHQQDLPDATLLCRRLRLGRFTEWQFQANRDY